MTKRIFRRTLLVAFSAIAIPAWMLVGLYNGLLWFGERFKEVWEDA